MKITKLEEQGMKLTMCLAKKNSQMTLPELAKLEGMSEALVAKVLGKLRCGGVVTAVRGRNGGYELTSAASEMTMTTVLSALGRPILEGCYLDEHSMSSHSCSHTGSCGLKPVWETVRDRMTHVFDSVTLADLIAGDGYVRSQMNNLSDVSDVTPVAESGFVSRSAVAMSKK